MSLTYPNLAVLGKAGAGKDTVAELLGETWPNLGYQRLALADPLKDVAAQLWGDEARRDRHKLQALGVAVREIHRDTWIDLAADEFERIRHLGPVVVTDCRFLNEWARFRELGFVVVRVLAPRWLRVDRLMRIGKLQDEADLDHVSEVELDHAPVDYELTNDDSREALADQLGDVLDAEAQ